MIVGSGSLRMKTNRANQCRPMMRLLPAPAGNPGARCPMGEEDTMKTRRITRPTLADLWRHLLATLEGLGAEDVPALARSLAVSGLVGRPAVALGVRVERSGEVFTITSPEPSMIRTAGVSSWRPRQDGLVDGLGSRRDADVV